MEALYTLCNIRKQSHLQAVAELKESTLKAPLYVNIIVEARNLHPAMGLRTIYETYCPQGIGRDAFLLLGRNAGYQLEQRRSATRTTFSVKSNLYRNLLADIDFTAVNQLWTSDITYFAIADKFYYLVFIMDVYSRRIVGYHAADNMRAENNVAALKMAIQLRAIQHFDQQLIHHSDRGTQYISNDYTNLLTSTGIKISMCNEVWENTHIERVNSTIKNYYLYHYRIQNFKDLQNGLKKAVHIYNFHKPHSALNGLTPVLFESLLPNVPLAQRTVLNIYTNKQNVVYQNQLSLDL